MRPPGEQAEHPRRVDPVDGLAVEPPVQVHRGVDAERDGAVAMHGARLPLGVRAHQRDRVGIRRVVLDVPGRDGFEGDPELLEDRAPLRRGRSQPKQLGAHCPFHESRYSPPASDIA